MTRVPRYWENLHQAGHVVHVAHVPQPWSQLTPTMTSSDILGHMQHVNKFSRRLRHVYDTLLENLGVSSYICVDGLLDFITKYRVIPLKVFLDLFLQK